jgi:hypothetical protein
MSSSKQPVPPAWHRVFAFPDDETLDRYASGLQETLAVARYNHTSSLEAQAGMQSALQTAGDYQRGLHQRMAARKRELAERELRAAVLSSTHH